MSVFVFTGPTLTPAQARAELDAVYLPPASQGDVYRVSQARPRAIGIIDGFFDQVPSVWHKEILWAMGQGIAVFGSASMGALRAAELAPFGMIGVGKIFESYRDGRIEDDDEVALVHGPAESDFRPGSEAMVNIRATLAAAESARVIPRKTRLALESIAKRLFYPERAWDAILDRAAADGLPPKQLGRLRAWLPSGRVDQKREDALAMLRAMRDHLAAPAAARQLSYAFENTVFWDRLVQSAGTLGPSADGSGDAAPPAPEMVPFDDLLDELRLVPDAFLEAHRECLLRQLILAEARRRGFQPKPEETVAVAAEFRSNFDLEDHAAFERWLAERHLTAQRFDEWMAEESLIRAVGADLWQETRRALPDLLPFQPGYARLLRRAGKKRRLLAEAGLEITNVADDPDALWDWFLADASSAASPFAARSILQSFSPNEAEALLRAKSRHRHFRHLTTPRRKKT